MDYGGSIPAVTGEEMAQVDQLMSGEFGLNVLQVMELAGWSVAAFAREQFLGNDPRGHRVIVLAGSGGNGGDGMVAARHLHGWGALVSVMLGRVPRQQSVAEHQLHILNKLGVPVYPPDADSEMPEADLFIDGLLGFSLRSAPDGTTKKLIEQANAHSSPTLAIDLPSGLHATDGTVFDPCIRAHTTLTLGLPKSGLLRSGAAAVVGDLYVADIGIPSEVYARLGLHVSPIFAGSFWRQLRR